MKKSRRKAEYSVKHELINRLKSFHLTPKNYNELDLGVDDEESLNSIIHSDIKFMFDAGYSLFSIRCNINEIYGAYTCYCGFSESTKHLQVYAKNGVLECRFDCRACRTARNIKSIQRRKQDPVFKLQNRVRISIASAFRLYVKDSKKGKKTANILGLDWDDFYKYLLENSRYNKVKSNIHLDHIIPISSAKSEEEVYILNHYSNFQLLSRKENLDKKNNYIKLVNLQRVLFHTPYKKEINQIIKREDFDII